MPEWPFGFAGSAADRLAGANLAGLTADKTWIGKHKNGTEFIQAFDRAGNTAYRTANTSITGIAEIRGDQLCEKIGGYFLDRMVCGYVYRNTTGEQTDMDYIHVTPQALKFFSLER